MGAAEAWTAEPAQRGNPAQAGHAHQLAQMSAQAAQNNAPARQGTRPAAIIIPMAARNGQVQ